MTALLPWRARWINLRAAALTFATGHHHYFATGCLHGRCDHCSATVGVTGPKIRNVCKFCPANCGCPHDVEERTGDREPAARWTCTKCGNRLSPCDVCAGPSLCGDGFCGAHTEDVA